MCEAIAFTWGAHWRACKTAPHISKAQPMTCQWRAGVGSSFGVAGLRARKSVWRQIAATNLRAQRPATPNGRPPHGPPHGPATNGKAIASPLAQRGSSFAGAPVRAPRKSNGKAQGKALPQTRAGPCEGGEGKVINHHPFPLAASPKACERKVILTSPFTVKGAANGGVKGERFSQTFPGPCLWPPTFLESLNLVRSTCFHLGRAGARLQNCFAHFKGSANDVPMACRGGASRPRRAAPPLGSPGGLAPPWPRQARPSRMRFAATPFR